MKKSLVVLGCILILAGTTDMKANKVWLVNLTKSKVSQNYYVSSFFSNNKEKIIRDVEPLTMKSDDISNKSVSALGVKEGKKNLTFIKYPNPDPKHPTGVKTETDETSPYKSKKLQKMVAELFQGKQPKDVIKNWPKNN